MTEGTLVYQALDSAKHNIRLIQFVEPSIVGRETGNTIDTACVTGVYSLDDYKNEYVEFERQSLGSWTTTERLENWKVSCPEEYPARYRWGDYLVMSHTWGNRNHTNRIVVDGEVVEISCNLAEGLRAISRHPAVVDGHLKLWVDFLCLDQGNKIEIQQELKRMPSLFSDAHAVIAWIGPAQDGSSIVMDLLENCIGDGDSPTTLDEILEYAPESAWKALISFLQRPYWRRLWIVQELTLASSRTSLLCGNQQARLRSLWALITIIIRNAPAFNRIFAASLEADDSYYNKVRHDVFAICARLNYLHRINESKQHGRSCNMLDLLDVCRSSLQQNDQDKVYGILGLLPPSVSILIEPNLDKTAHDVYADLARAVIRSTERLDILQNCRIGLEKPKLPSWTPDLQVNCLSHTLGTRAIMNAGGDPDARPCISADGLLLICKGVLFDIIDHLTPPQWPLAAVSPVQLSESLTSKTNTIQERATVRDALWMTLVGGSAGGSHESCAPAEYAHLLHMPWSDSSDDVYTQAQNLIDQGWCRAEKKQDLITFLYFRHRAKPGFDLCGHTLGSFFPRSHYLPQSDLLESPSKEEVQWMEQALRQACLTLKRRRLIVAASGRLGAAVREARKGDHIAVLSGCSAPVILRPMSESQSGSETQRFMIVGDCYVRDLMSGEAFRTQGKAVQDIVLC